MAVEKERKKAEKAKKFAEKQAKIATTAATGPSKSKDKKTKPDAVKVEPLPEYIEETPPGQKKSWFSDYAEENLSNSP
jgi:valyl-tRNA synthetase